MRGKPAEHHRMHRADPRAGQHRLQRLGDHRHVDDDAVALFHALGTQRPGQRGDAVLQLGEGDLVGDPGDRAVMDDRELRAPARRDMAVDRVPAGVDAAIGEPAAERGGVVEQGFRGQLRPVEALCGLHPEGLGIGLPGGIGGGIAHDLSPQSRFAKVSQTGARRARRLLARAPPPCGRRRGARGGRARASADRRSGPSLLVHQPLGFEMAKQ
jgi:hypothetical protein